MGRRQQKELLLPASITLVGDDDASLSSLLEGIAGFAIVERATMRKTHNLRSPVEVSPSTLMKIRIDTVAGRRTLGFHVSGSNYTNL